ncbi:MAG: nickel pincer cofactor biosynthesis protein LarB [Lachnospiraceae bacterium]|nr:nickel pincer cofactor biosynthesis protein LarB [Lachnospiraceae bacterium]
MNKEEMLALLKEVQSGEKTPEEAILKMKLAPFEEVGNFARVDYHRGLRQGQGEVIYGLSKTAEQIEGIVLHMLRNGQENILITRVSKEKAEALNGRFPFTYHEVAQLMVAAEHPREGTGSIVVVSGGTSDMPVCEEAALTAETFGNKVTRLYDVGVAGLERLLSNLEPIMTARVIIAVAGMEGALASVVGGLADAPVIAVPTSVGYGASFHGLSALLSMLNSCASGVSVVNIDNGFGAGYLASMINKMH